MLNKQQIMAAYGYRCAVSGREAHDLHHIVPQTKINKKRWPLYIHSPMNLIPINRDVHMSQPLPPKPSDMQLDLYEAFLREIKGVV